MDAVSCATSLRLNGPAALDRTRRSVSAWVHRAAQRLLYGDVTPPLRIRQVHHTPALHVIATLFGLSRPAIPPGQGAVRDTGPGSARQWRHAAVAGNGGPRRTTEGGWWMGVFPPASRRPLWSRPKGTRGRVLAAAGGAGCATRPGLPGLPGPPGLSC